MHVPMLAAAHAVVRRLPCLAAPYMYAIAGNVSRPWSRRREVMRWARCI